MWLSTHPFIGSWVGSNLNTISGRKLLPSSLNCGNELILIYLFMNLFVYIYISLLYISLPRLFQAIPPDVDYTVGSKMEMSLLSRSICLNGSDRTWGTWIELWNGLWKKKQVKSMKENKGGANYEGQDGASERLMVKLRPLGFRVRLVNGTELRGLNWGKGKFIIWKCLGAEKSLKRDGTVRRLVGQVYSQLERRWQEIRMEKTGWKCDFEIYSLCKGKLPKALSQDVVWL